MFSRDNYCSLLLTAATILLLLTGRTYFKSIQEINAINILKGLADDKLKNLYMHQSIKRKNLLQQYLLPNSTKLGIGPYYNGLVPEVVCPWLARVGDVNDGGKWTCNPWALSSSCVIYSLGVGYDVTFETEMDEVTEGRCKIYSFDSDINKGNQIVNLNNERLIFHPYKIAEQTDHFEQQASVKDIMKQLQHSFINFLKVDIEGRTE